MAASPSLPDSPVVLATGRLRRLQLIYTLLEGTSSLVQTGHSLAHAGESLVRPGEASPLAGESGIPACTGLHPPWWRDVSPRVPGPSPSRSGPSLSRSGPSLSR